MGKTWTFTAPPSNHPEAFEEGIEIELREPNDDLTDKAFTLASAHEKKARAVYLKHAQTNLLILCLKRVGDEPYTYEDLKDGGLEREFGEYKQRMLQQLLDKISTPEDQEVEDFFATATPQVSSSSGN